MSWREGLPEPCETDLIDTEEAARIWKIKPDSYRAYARRGYAPGAIRKIGKSLAYCRAQVKYAYRHRDGQGARTDKRKN